MSVPCRQAGSLGTGRPDPLPVAGAAAPGAVRADADLGAGAHAGDGADQDGVGLVDAVALGAAARGVLDEFVVGAAAVVGVIKHARTLRRSDGGSRGPRSASAYSTHLRRY